jgi:hypothetical protein
MRTLCNAQRPPARAMASARRGRRRAACPTFCAHASTPAKKRSPAPNQKMAAASAPPLAALGDALGRAVDAHGRQHYLHAAWLRRAPRCELLARSLAAAASCRPLSGRRRGRGDSLVLFRHAAVARRTPAGAAAAVTRGAGADPGRRLINTCTLSSSPRHAARGGHRARRGRAGCCWVRLHARTSPCCRSLPLMRLW